MTLKVQHKRSAVKGKAPLPTDLEYGEIAVNYEATDPALYIKDSADAVRKIGTQPAATETAAGIVELATAAETTTGTDATRAVHPAGLKVELDKLKLWDRTGTTLSPATAGDTIHGQLVPTNGALGSRNVIINGELRINQRVVTIAAAAVGAYGPDRWKKVDATNMTQIIEDLSFVPGAKYTLGWKGGAAQVLTAPASGHWTLPNIPITATEIQLEPGTVATPFEQRPIGTELALCQRYFQELTRVGWRGDATNGEIYAAWYNHSTMRTTPSVVIADVSLTGFTAGIAVVANGASYLQAEATCNSTGVNRFWLAIAKLSAEL